jgi:hypothetical protein
MKGKKSLLARCGPEWVMQVVVEIRNVKQTKDSTRSHESHDDFGL